jgi:RimJ/RimL family protein N-acetyltransferase
LTVFEISQLIARQWALDDLDAFTALFCNPGMWTYLPGEPPAGREAARSMMERMLGRMQRWHGMGSFAVVRRVDDVIVGNLLLRPLGDNEEVEVGYHIGVPFWGNGYATEITTGAVCYGFEELGLQEIYGLAVPENTASRRVLEKSGLTWIERGHYYGLECDVLRIVRQIDDDARLP